MSDEKPADTAAAQPQADAELDLPPLEEGKGSLLNRLNPLNLLKKETPGRFVADGRDLLENKNFAQATIAFKKALSLDAQCVPAHKGLGDVLLKKGGRTNVGQALEHYRKVLELDPFYDSVYALTAKVYEALGKPKEATLERKKMVVVKTLATDPRNPVANNNMGILLLRQNRVTDAIDYFQRATEADPHYDMAFRNLATVYYKLATATQDEARRKDLLNRADGPIAKALEVSRSVPNLLTQARILSLQGQDAQALELVEQAAHMEPASKDVFGLKKLLLERLNRMDEARQAFESYRVFSRATGHPAPAKAAPPRAEAEEE